jgi:alpha-glucosidase (family GH31 glycosyl hydrolase)
LIEKIFLGNGLLVYPITEADINQVSIYLPGENTVRRAKIKIKIL